MNDEIFNELISLANIAAEKDEIPISALLVKNNKIISSAYNLRNSSANVFDHAEIIAISNYSNTCNDWRLVDCDLYVTIEPCEMCKQFIKESRIRDVYYILPRLDYKKGYYKTSFIHTNLGDDKVNIYKNILDLFWKNKR